MELQQRPKINPRSKKLDLGTSSVYERLYYDGEKYLFPCLAPLMPHPMDPLMSHALQALP